MSKDQLEEIKYWYEYNSNNDWKMMAFDKGHIVWLIEQAERVQELEDTLEQDARQGVLEGLYEENKRYRGKIMTSIEELELVLYSGKSDDVKELYLKNAVRFLNEALEGDPHESS